MLHLQQPSWGLNRVLTAPMTGVPCRMGGLGDMMALQRQHQAVHSSGRRGCVVVMHAFHRKPTPFEWCFTRHLWHTWTPGNIHLNIRPHRLEWHRLPGECFEGIRGAIPAGALQRARVPGAPPQSPPPAGCTSGQHQGAAHTQNQWLRAFLCDHDVSFEVYNAHTLGEKTTLQHWRPACGLALG